MHGLYTHAHFHAHTHKKAKQSAAFHALGILCVCTFKVNNY